MTKNFLVGIQNKFSRRCIVLVTIVIFVFSVSFIIDSKEENKKREYTLGGPDNFLGLDNGENSVMIIDEESTAQKRDYYYLLHRWRIQSGKECQKIFPIYKPNPYFPIVITENIKNSQLVQDKHYLVHEEQLLGTTLRWIEIIEYPQFLKETEEFILTIQYYVNHKEIGVIYRNFWIITMYNIDPNNKKIIGRVSIILPKDAYIWKSDKSVWITPFIKKEEHIDIDIEDRIGVSWYLTEEPIQTIKLGFGTPVERLHWENKELATQQFIMTLAGLFLAITVPIRLIKSVKLLIYPEKRDLILNCGLVFFVMLISCYLIFYIKILEFPIKTDLHYWAGGTLFILVLIHFGLREFYEKCMR
ncbi:MAG TPA: hypothetical protein ENI52_03540 [Thermoplasmata archaeon]|nr:hypothetical protein [Thermoplasmata archaeon]